MVARRLDRVEDARQLGQLVVVGFAEYGVGFDHEVACLYQQRDQPLVAARLLFDLAVPQGLLGDLTCTYHPTDASTVGYLGQAGLQAVTSNDISATPGH